MDLVVDANILFAALVRDGFTRRLMEKEDFELFSPDFVLAELSEYLPELLEKSNRSWEDFQPVSNSLVELLSIVSKVDYAEFLIPASKFSPDSQDIPYFALALKLGAALWSNDALLKKQKIVQVFSTRELALL